MYNKLLYKTIDQIYNMLPINGHTKLFCDVCGKYYPDRDKEKFGDLFAISVFDFTDEYLYVATYLDSRR